MERGSGVEKKFDLARIDGRAGVRKGHESMEDVRERGEGVDERWR